MSAPVTERPRGRTATIPAQRVEPAPGLRRDKSRDKNDTAAKKAYARRDDRLRRLVEGLQPREGSSAGRAQFVLLVMVLLAVGLVATLWLSTAATADSYVLQQARDDARGLREQSERLHREVAAMDSAPELARRAGELGMVPVQDPARLVVAPDGNVTVVGTPKAVVPPPPPVVPASPGAQAEGGPDSTVGPDGQPVPGGQAPDATQQDPSRTDPSRTDSAAQAQGGGQGVVADRQGQAGAAPADQAPQAGARQQGQGPRAGAAQPAPIRQPSTPQHGAGQAAQGEPPVAGTGRG